MSRAENGIDGAPKDVSPFRDLGVARIAREIGWQRVVVAAAVLVGMSTLGLGVLASCTPPAAVVFGVQTPTSDKEGYGLVPALPPEASAAPTVAPQGAEEGGGGGVSPAVGKDSSGPALVEITPPSTPKDEQGVQYPPPETETPRPPTPTSEPSKRPTPASSPTPSPTPSPTETPTPVCGELTLKGETGVNIRKGPGTNYQIIETLGKGEKILVRGKTPDGKWVLGDLVKPDGTVTRDVWIASPELLPELVEITCGLERVQPIPWEQIPPPPTPEKLTPTPTKEAPQLEAAIQDFLSGKMPIDESVRWRSVITGPLPLGAYENIGVEDRYLHFIQGIFLGYKDISGIRVVFLGFVDGKGTRFVIPFQFGYSLESVVTLKNEPNRTVEGHDDRFAPQRLRVKDTDEILDSFFGRAVISSLVREWGPVDKSRLPPEIQELFEEQFWRAEQIIKLIKRTCVGGLGEGDIPEIVNNVENIDPKVILPAVSYFMY